MTIREIIKNLENEKNMLKDENKKLNIEINKIKAEKNRLNIELNSLKKLLDTNTIEDNIVTETTIKDEETSVITDDDSSDIPDLISKKRIRKRKK